MRFDLPKTVRPIALQDYDPGAERLAGVEIMVWVDPPREWFERYYRIHREYSQAILKDTAALKKSRPLTMLNIFLRKAPDDTVQRYRKALHDMFASLWSQGPDGTHWTAEEIDRMDDHNPAFTDWLYRRSWELIEEHKSAVKKGSRPPEPKPPAAE